MSKNSQNQDRVKVWDGFVRLFHWSLVLGFVLAYISVHFGRQEFHALAGYFLVGLIIARIIWGFIGSKYAQFTQFVYSPATTLNYMKDILRNRPGHYLGHNPAGGAMVIALLATLLMIVISGLMVNAMFEYEGPLLFLLQDCSDEFAYSVFEFHEEIVELSLFLIGFHLLGVVAATIQHKENLVRAMITGYKSISTSHKGENHA